MKIIIRSGLSLLGALALPVLALAQTATTPTTPPATVRPTTPGTAVTPTTPTVPPSTPTVTPTTPATSGPSVLVTPARTNPFATFESASPAVQTAVVSATASAQIAGSGLEEAIRLGLVVPATRVGPAGTPGSPAIPATTTGPATPAAPVLPTSVTALPTAVAQATTVIVTDGRIARSDSLTQRETALARLRTAQTDADRQRVIDELRVKSGERLEEQRETARLVRDRIRQLRDITTITRPGTI